MYSYLFKNAAIGTLDIKNRSVMAPMGTGFADKDGFVTDRLIRYYEERAKGGIGLIIVEAASVDNINSIPFTGQVRINNDGYIPGLEKLTRAVRKHGAKIILQIHHAGSTANPSLTGRRPLSPSDVAPVPGGNVPKPMTKEEIKEVQQKFINAAARCKKAGFDGVELHGAHSYLIAQFFSEYYNRRSDEYGGSFENRMRFISGIIDGIRSELPGYPLLVRISGDEMTPDIPNTLTLKDGLQIARFLQSKGIDAIDISNGGAMNPNANCDPASYTPGWKKHIAKAYKDALSIPVIATNTIKTPQFAEQMLSEGICDYVAIGRALLADPEFINKALQGRENEIVQCIGCMYCRKKLLVEKQPLECAANPSMGNE
jgi:2,4-dienoyl-CoA reductase-like NADH-dependent reductase (Old Yellow Enzyme family)